MSPLSGPEHGPDAKNQAGHGSSQSTTDLLLEAAARVFGLKGYDAATVSEIARSCGLTTGAIYSRWPSKRDIFVAVVDYVAPKRIEILLGDPDTPRLAQFAALGASMLNSGDDIYRSLILEAGVAARRDELLRATISRAFKAEAEAVATMVSELKDAGVVDPSVSTEAIVLCTRALELGCFLTSSVASDEGRNPTADEWKDLMRRFIESVLVSRPDEARS